MFSPKYLPPQSLHSPGECTFSPSGATGEKGFARFGSEAEVLEVSENIRWRIR